MNRQAEITRKTGETDICLRLNLDGTGKAEVNTGIGFLDHMLEAFSRHGFFDLKVEAKGDLHVDYHHTVEDIGICLGQAVAEALGDKKGIQRYGNVSLPMDEALASVVLDISGRGMLVFKRMPAEEPLEGTAVVMRRLFQDTGGVPESGGDANKRFDVLLVQEFFRAFSQHSSTTIHISADGENGHHIIEAIFKAFARALCMAVEVNRRVEGVLSTKGMI